MDVKVNARWMGEISMELGTRVRWRRTDAYREDEHDGSEGTLARDGENGPVVVVFDDLCQRYAHHGQVEVVG
jgi:hypothetical protein